MAISLLLDSSAYIEFCRGNKKAVSALSSVSHVSLPFICLAELRAGFAASSQSAENVRAFRKFLNSDAVDILWADDGTTQMYARVFAQLRRDGKPIPTNDLWIASLALQHELPLLTFDRHFESVPFLSLV